MENQLNNTERKYNKNTAIGFVMLFAGLAFLLDNTNLVFFPHWLFSWPILLIVVGLAFGAKNNFQKSGWIIVTGIGVLFLLTNIIPSLHVIVLWPLILVALGIRLLTRHTQYWNGTNWVKRDSQTFQHYDKSI